MFPHKQLCTHDYELVCFYLIIGGKSLLLIYMFVIIIIIIVFGILIGYKFV